MGEAEHRRVGSAGNEVVQQGAEAEALIVGVGTDSEHRGGSR